MSLQSKATREHRAESNLWTLEQQPIELAAPHRFSEQDEFINAFWHSPDTGLAILDTQFRFAAVNQALAAMNGIEQAEHLGKTVKEVLGAASQAIHPLLERVLGTGQAAANIKVTALFPSREKVGQWLGSYFPIKDRKGKVRQIAATVLELPGESKPGASVVAQNRGSSTLMHDPARDSANVVGFHPARERTRQSERVTTLFDSALFSGLDSEMVHSIARIAKKRRCLPGGFFCLQSENAKAVYLLTTGRVKSCAITGSGKQVLLDWIEPGEVFGLGALVSPPLHYLWNVQAVEHSEAMCWDSADILRISRLFPSMFENALRIALEWSTRLESQLELRVEPVEQRLAHCALDLARRSYARGVDEICVSNQELADMTGTNLFSVNKLLNRWERLGHIQKSRKRLFIGDSKSLMRISVAERRSNRATKHSD